LHSNAPIRYFSLFVRLFYYCTIVPRGKQGHSPLCGIRKQQLQQCSCCFSDCQKSGKATFLKKLHSAHRTLCPQSAGKAHVRSAQGVFLTRMSSEKRIPFISRLRARKPCGAFSAKQKTAAARMQLLF
ncbi:MAG: hypothetical protein II420_00195, partial [Oscillospiraceae bacterium]|nr:hypothetical protein [Oscillospiraceae bacterium]